MVKEKQHNDEHITHLVDVVVYELTPGNGGCPLYIKRVTVEKYDHVSNPRGSFSYSDAVLDGVLPIPAWDNFVKYLTHFGQYRLETIDEYSYYTQTFNDTSIIGMLI